MTTTALDAESPLDDLDDAESPLLHRPSSRKDKDARYHRSSLSVIELDSIPPIIKSANGNIFWADEQCTRRVGLTSTEARLFLRLLQTDEPENYNYDDYKAMFDDFGREQSYLEDLVRRLPWWKLDTYHQKPIWRARIKWLKRMKEPRLWLLYLMARRRRILTQAAVRILGRFKEQSKVRRRMKEGGPLHHENGLKTTGMSAEQQEHGDAIRPVMTNDASQTSERLLSIPLRDSVQRPVSFKNRSSFSSHHKGSRASGQDSHSRSSGHCPVFDRPFEATREDIKKIVELLMPKPTPYIVIGWFLRSASDPKERILEFENPADLFRVLRNGERDVRGWRRLVSLKSLKGFGLYKCDIARGAHLPLLLMPSQKAIMSQFFLAYKASYRHSDDTVAAAWQGWVQKNLNDNKENPLEGRYSLQLLYDWSSFRLSFVVMVPLLLSFVIGLWYMLHTGDIITAWTIALYIVTAAAAFIALLAIIGSLKDI